MRAYFQVELPDYRLLQEFELATPTKTQLTALQSRSLFEGVLVLAWEDNPDVRIGDTLEALVLSLCFGAVPRLLAGEVFDLRYYSHAGVIHVATADDWVTLSGDDIATARFPKRELAPALVACGVRFLRWARAIKANASGYQAGLDDVEAMLAPAVAALTTAGLPTPPP